jgi:hypothetical protein
MARIRQLKRVLFHPLHLASVLARKSKLSMEQCTELFEDITRVKTSSRKKFCLFFKKHFLTFDAYVLKVQSTRET